MDREEYFWVEKYRPHKIDDCVLPDRLKNIFKGYVEQGEFITQLFAGGPGVGKTTVAKALCDEIGLDYMLVNGSEQTGIDLLRTTIRSYASTMSLTGGKKVIIVDEADYMNPNSLQPALRGAIEEFSKNCVFIFTCNYKNRIIEPIRDSRCAVIEFKLVKKELPIMAAKFYTRCEQILQQENVTYDKQVVGQLVCKYFPDCRRILNELQTHSVTGKLSESILANLNDVDLKDLITHLKNKDFQKTRKWVNDNGDGDPNRLFRRIYDEMSNMLKPESVPQAVLIVAKYQYQAAFSLDVEINLLAFLTELMVECTFR